MKKERYLEILRNDPHADELVRQGFRSGVCMCILFDPDLTVEEVKELFTEAREDEE